MFGQILLQIILILLNAFFAATEIAIISLNEKKVKARAEEGDKKAKKMLKMIKDPTKFLSTIQIGITLAGFLGSAFAADNFATRLTDFFVKAFSLTAESAAIVNTVSVVLITLILSFFTLVFGELVPKRLAMKNKEKLANAVCGTITGMTVVLKPVIWLLTVSTNGVLRLCGVNPKETEEAVSEEDIVLLLDAGADEGTLKQDDIQYIKNVFKLDSMVAEDVMTPRRSVVCIADTATDAEILSIIENEGYSRIPVYSGESDNVIGIVRAREYLLKRGLPAFELKQVIVDPIYTPESKPLVALFREMQKTHMHIAVVVNEYGFMSGVVTMEDVLEQIVGEIWDEQDEAIEWIEQQSENRYLVKTSGSVETFFDYFRLTKDEKIESATVNGWLIERYEDIPKEGDSFTYENITVTITQADTMQTLEICVEVAEKPKDEEDE